MFKFSIFKPQFDQSAGKKNPSGNSGITPFSPAILNNSIIASLPLVPRLKGIFIHEKLDMIIHNSAVHLLCIAGNKIIRSKRIFVSIFETSPDYAIDF